MHVLQLPVDFLKKQTPALRQWWEIKRDNFDTVLMFKVHIPHPPLMYSNVLTRLCRLVSSMSCTTWTQ